MDVNHRTGFIKEKEEGDGVQINPTKCRWEIEEKSERAASLQDHLLW